MVIRCVRRPCVTCGPVFFYFVTFRIIMEIWDFCLEISLKIIEIFQGLSLGTLLPELMMSHSQLNPQAQTSVKFESKCKTSHTRKCSWNAVRMAAILFRPQCVKLQNFVNFVYADVLALQDSRPSVGRSVTYTKLDIFSRKLLCFYLWFQTIFLVKQSHSKCLSRFRDSFWCSKVSTHFDPVIPYGIIDLGQHWLQYWLAAW